jgi:hypothetical protein
MPKVLAGFFVLGVGLLGLPGRSQAQLVGTGGTIVGGTGGIGGTTTSLATTDFFIGVQGDEGVNLSEYQRGIYFNKANCDCEKPTWIFVALSQTGLAKRSTITRGNAQVWVGTSCDQTVLRPTQCTQIAASVLLTDFAARGGVSIKTTAKALSTRQIAVTGTGGTTGIVTACNETAKFTQTVFLLVDQDADGAFDLAPTQTLDIDVNPPPPPTDVTIRGGNDALVVNWKPINTTVDESADLLGYQLLCNRAGEFQVFPTGSYSPAYASTATQCPDMATDTGSVEALDPKFLCSGLLGVVATAHRIKVLQNYITYGVTVVAIDKHGNPSLPDVFYGNPVASTDFYGFYRDGNSSNGAPGGMPDPGHDQGGFCTIGGTSDSGGFAAAPLLGLGVVVVTAGVVMRRRRRRR